MKIVGRGKCGTNFMRTDVCKESKLVRTTYYNKSLFTVLMKIQHKYIYRDPGFCKHASLLANCVVIYGSASFLDCTLDIKYT